MKVDPAQARAAAAVVLQHVAQCLLAPGGCAAAVEQAPRVAVLAAADDGLQGALAVGGHVGVQLRLGGGRRPLRGHDGRGHLGVGGVGRQLTVEVVEVAVQVDVLVRGAAPPREAVGVQRVHVEQRHAGGMRLLAEAGVGQQRALHARAAVALDAVAGAADQQHCGRVGRAVAHDIHRERLAVLAQQRVRVRLHLQPGLRGRCEEARAGLGVGLSEVCGSCHGRGALSHFSAMRTHAVAPSGIRSSLKS